MPVLADTAYAKVNLALHIRNRRSDGYHEIETLFAFVDAGDSLTASEADELTLSITGPFNAGLESNDNNLVLRAASFLQQRFGVRTGAALTLEKNLPVASGIGGGSADAAAAARLLNILWGLQASDAELAALLEPLGADIPACVASKTVIGRGTGADLEAISADELFEMPILLVNPLKPVSTGAVFSRWDGIDRGALAEGDAACVLAEGRNDLEPMAIDVCPDITEILSALRKTSPIAARMSGSGATCFALYQTVEARDKAARAMNSNWWILSGKLR
jgi:4-diphosphocytidyl-2-C-methyl-D-erythritol kinase